MFTARLLIDGEWTDGEGSFSVPDRFTGEPVAHVARASRDQVDAAVAAARRAFESGPLDPRQRYEILLGAARGVEERRDRIIETIVAESGFTVSDGAAEVTRCVETLTLSAEESKRITGEMIPIEAAPGQSKRMGYTIRVPVGVVCAITPFNSPLNTVAHKVGPALAAGNAVVLKPASYTPLTAGLLAEALVDAGLPAGYLNLVHGPGAELGAWLLENPYVDFYTFTGSTEVGRAIRQAVGLRRTSLELGSISATIVCEDADLDDAVPKCIGASFRKAGQVCTSVQRLYVHREVLEDFLRRLGTALEQAKSGDPRDPDTLVGPMIEESEAVRAQEWIREAVDAGARIVLGGERDGAVLPPTVLSDVSADMRVMCEEIFAPVISVVPYDDLGAAIEAVNATPYGLAAGIFTRDLSRAIDASHKLRVGGVHVNQTSSSRVDLMPYGGVKASGHGLEGPRYAALEMTEQRLVTISW